MAAAAVPVHNGNTSVDWFKKAWRRERHIKRPGWLHLPVIWYQHTAEKAIGHNFRAAQMHEKNGTPFGHKVYDILYKDSLAHATELAKRKGVDVDEIFALFPALSQLQQKTHKAASGRGSGSGIKRVILLVFLAPAGFAMMTVVYRLILHWFGM